MSCMYIYKDITNTQWDISFVLFLFFLVCLGLQVWLKAFDWCLCMHWLLKQNNLKVLQCAAALMQRDGRLFFFLTSEIQNHCPGTGRCGLLMYSNVSHWSFLNLIHDWLKIAPSDTRSRRRSQMCGLVWIRSPLWGSPWPPHHGDPASLVQSFSRWVFKVSYLMDSEHCHVDNQSGSLFTRLLGQYNVPPRKVNEIWLGLWQDLTVQCGWRF